MAQDQGASTSQTRATGSAEASSTLKLSLKADSGFRSEGTSRITLDQWKLINLAVNSPPALVTFLLGEASSLVEQVEAQSTGEVL